MEQEHNLFVELEEMLEVLVEHSPLVEVFVEHSPLVNERRLAEHNLLVERRQAAMVELGEQNSVACWHTLERDPCQLHKMSQLGAKKAGNLAWELRSGDLRKEGYLG